MVHLFRAICISSVAFCCALAAGDVSKSSAVSEMDDASEVTWAHAVNSLSALQQELKGEVTFLEADVSLGHVSLDEFGPAIPVMAHPPDVLSDVSLDNWLDIVTRSGRGKGVKLDFKSLAAVEPSLELLKKHEKNITFPLWLNADIVHGPVNSETIPVPWEQFLKICHKYFPNVTLSLGWTTNWHATLPPETWHYEWQHIRSMADAVYCRDKARDRQNAKVTFAVRGIFASRSIEQLRWLLGAVPGSTLTVWSDKFDPLDVQDLMAIRSAFPKSGVYYDIPRTVGESFRTMKNSASVHVPSVQTFVNRNWMMVSRGESDLSCASFTYVNNDAVLFGQSLTTAILLKNPFALSEGQRLQAQGYVTFLHQMDKRQVAQELVLVLADVSLFSKNTSTDTVDDSDVVWSALNSSRLHVFQNDGSGPSCHMFRLDTTLDKAFQAWTLPCDVLYDGNAFEDDAKFGRQVITSRKRLVLPAGPVMFGFMSSGGSHTVVHRLQVTGETKPVSSDSKINNVSLLKFLMVMIASVMIAFVIM